MNFWRLINQKFLILVPAPINYNLMYIKIHAKYLHKRSIHALKENE